MFWLSYLSALLKDVTVALVIVTGCPRLGEHVRHVEGLLVELEGGQAGVVLSGQLAAELTGFGRRISRPLRALARLHAVGEADGPCALLKPMKH